MTPLEKLARRICWLEFVKPRTTGTTEARYWGSLPEETRQAFMEEAGRTVWVLNACNRNVSSQAILSQARREKAK